MIDIDEPTALLGGLSPVRFMQRHWHKKPLLVRQAVPGVSPPIGRPDLFALAASDDVESRLVVREHSRWRLRHGPLPRRALPPLNQPGWTLLVQGLDLHVDAAHELLTRFRFVPDARLDDVMLSYASDGGGVGPHTDSYDVFLLQVSGRRRWRIGRCTRPEWRDDVPLKMLERFDVQAEWVLDPGDMLYLPPDWAHDGSAVGGDCMTASVGFRAPTEGELAHALLARVADTECADATRYRDPTQHATAHPGSTPPSLQAFARRAVMRVVRDASVIDQVLGEWLTEPKPQVWFETVAGARLPLRASVVLDRRTRMGYDDRRLFINGESYRATGVDAKTVRILADTRRLASRDVTRLSTGARALLQEWLAAGWLHVEGARSDDS